MVESATQEDCAHPENNFCNKYNPYLSTDNQVYKGGIAAYTRNQKDRASLVMPHNDRALWHLINLGAQDMPALDKSWDAPTRSMCFATCLADRLWVMLEREHARVWLLLTYLAIKELRQETKGGWKKLAMPLDQVIKANNASNHHLKQCDINLSAREDIMDGWVAHNQVQVQELQTKV